MRSYIILTISLFNEFANHLVFGQQLNGSEECVNGFCPNYNYGPHSPYVPCIHLPVEFLECEELYDHKGNETAREEMGFGCSKFGGQKYEDMQFSKRNCTVFDSIQCYGDRNFMKPNFPCIKYNGHYFVTTLLYSLLLGFFGNGSLLFRTYGNCCRQTIDIRRSRHLVDRRYCPLSHWTSDARRRQ